MRALYTCAHTCLCTRLCALSGAERCIDCRHGCRHVCRHVCRHALAMCLAGLECSRPVGSGECRQIYIAMRLKTCRRGMPDVESDLARTRPEQQLQTFGYSSASLPSSIPTGFVAEVPDTVIPLDQRLVGLIPAALDKGRNTTCTKRCIECGPYS